MPGATYRVPFQLDHVIAEQHGGTSSLRNLAWSCFHCNLHKGPNLTGKDPRSRRTTRLFHPRRDRWDDHFRWQGARLVGLTAVGRTTIAVLAVNHPACVAVRQALIDAGLFVP